MHLADSFFVEDVVDLLRPEAWEIEISHTLSVELAHYKWIRRFIHIVFMPLHMQIFHLEDQLIRVTQVEVLLKQVLTLEVIRIYSTIVDDLITLAKEEASFLEHLDL